MLLFGFACSQSGVKLTVVTVSVVFFSSSLSSLFSRYTFSINNLRLHLYFAVSLDLLLSYSHFFISHTFHGTGRIILTYSKKILYVWVAGNIPCILTQGAIQFCSSTFFSCFVQPSVLTAYRLLSRTIIAMIPFKLT